MNYMRNFFEKKPVRIIVNILKAFCLAFFILFILMVCLQRFSNNEVSFFNYRMFTVASGSMEPKYKIGDVLISKEKEPSKVKVGDAITYLGQKNSFKDKVVTHEVISIEQDSEGKYLFHAKGLANLMEDPVVSESQLYGVVVYKSIILSFIYKIIGTKYGLFIFVILPLLFIIGSEIVSAMLDKEEQRRQRIKRD